MGFWVAFGVGVGVGEADGVGIGLAEGVGDGVGETVGDASGEGQGAPVPGAQRRIRPSAPPAAGEARRPGKNGVS